MNEHELYEYRLAKSNYINLKLTGAPVSTPTYYTSSHPKVTKYQAKYESLLDGGSMQSNRRRRKFNEAVTAKKNAVAAALTDTRKGVSKSIASRTKAVKSSLAKNAENVNGALPSFLKYNTPAELLVDLKSDSELGSKLALLSKIIAWLKNDPGKPDLSPHELKIAVRIGTIIQNHM